MLDAPSFAMPPVRPGSGRELREISTALAKGCEPSTVDQRRRILIGLRSATQRRDETAKEAQASFDLLVAHLAGIPEDILASECRHYAKTQRFFPRGASDLKRALAMTEARRMRVYRLGLMADEADRLDAERKRLAEPIEWTPEAIRDLGPMARGRMEAGWFTAAQLHEAFAGQ